MNKYEWMDAVMASKMTPATKTFAYGLYKHMDKEGVCYPGCEALSDATGMKRGHFVDYRRTLIDEGWIEVEERPTKAGMSYTYTANMTREVSLNMTPVVTESDTSGDESDTSGAQYDTTGVMNTVYNTTNNSTRNPLNDRERSKAIKSLPEVELVGSKVVPRRCAAVESNSSLSSKTDSEILEHNLQKWREEKEALEALTPDW